MIFSEKDDARQFAQSDGDLLNYTALPKAFRRRVRGDESDEQNCRRDGGESRSRCLFENEIETDPKKEGDNEDNGMVSVDDDQIIDDLLAQLKNVRTSDLSDAAYRLSVIGFEKDDIRTHMECISGLSNMRARNYDIAEVDKLQAKLIRVNHPCYCDDYCHGDWFSLLGVVQSYSQAPLESFRNTFANLALPLFAMAEPIAPKFQMQDEKWSLWSRWVIDKDYTVREL